eukprot:TRINITY_DN18200_c0_g1_i1.p1 TRINITY_DN18200_c0_g1~~TRINITY_DN18200_c0_g1_i1.p1  ORF type:complete len:282 (+),score=44.03 TRINITY_DN18200_c0_g1_i1:48-848(+)
MTSAKDALPQSKVAAQQEWFVCPDWVGSPTPGTHLEVRKGGVAIERIPIDGHPYYMLGRNEEVVDIPMDHASLSRVHCVLVHHRKGSCYVIDLASNHGVYVNDVRIPSKKTQKITEDDTIRVGGSSRLIHLKRNAPEPLAVSNVLKRAKVSSDAHHILIKFSDCNNPISARTGKAVTRSKEQALQKLKLIHSKLVSSSKISSDIKEAAKATSECQSYTSGGDISSLDQSSSTCKALLAAAEKLSPGELSGPVKTDEGVHLVFRSSA